MGGNNDDNRKILPSIVLAYNKLYGDLLDIGLTERDIILLIQSRTKPKQNISSVTATVEAIEKLLVDLEKKLD